MAGGWAVGLRLPVGLSVRHRVVRRLGRLFGWPWESSPRMIRPKQHL